MEELITGLLIVTIGNLIYIQKRVAKISNELTHLQAALETLQSLLNKKDE